MSYDDRTPSHADLEQVRERMTVASTLGTRYQERRAAACLVTGSVATGWADRWSDVELLVIWGAVPDAATRQNQMVATELGLRAFDVSSPLDSEDHIIVFDLKCEVAPTSITLVHEAVVRLRRPDRT
jgi:hypothetical protein